MAVNPIDPAGIPKIGPVGGAEEIARPRPGAGAQFGEALADAIKSVDGLQKQSETAQTAYAKGADVDLHDVLIKVEEAELAFKTMMEVRNKLLDAYREVMRIGSGG